MSFSHIGGCWAAVQIVICPITQRTLLGWQRDDGGCAGCVALPRVGELQITVCLFANVRH